ncbi:Plasma membrane proteolipid 3 [Lasiodiplodia theobromae]|uniref:Plasma membrane proteolipid 3 n=1 Tax=Lasiodiplodia theobromae TaxID=45133 RepID=UPI0015C33461|nr:Plasma membrane proteolipid 3 [Lasiodiplodia theobromae]KAF4544762.1 Plasma membrane proteolipid 3 [Lasiodiplodia theobromae]
MAICYRLFITITNIFFPPLAVIFLTGFGMDTLINALLFLAAILPSHIHAFYLSCTYFARRHRVRRGRAPGGPKPFIYSENILYGGARWDEVQELQRQQSPSTSSSSNKKKSRHQQSPYVTPSGFVVDDRSVSSRRDRGGSGGGGVGGAQGAAAGGYAGLRYGLGDADAAGWNASNGVVVGSGYGQGYGPTEAYRGGARRARSAY